MEVSNDLPNQPQLGDYPKQTTHAQQESGWFYWELNMRTIRYWPRFLGRDNTCCRGGLGGHCDRS